MPKKYKHIILDDRTLIQTQLQQGFKPAAIVASLGPPRSCVTRELARNGWQALPAAPLHWAANRCRRLFFQPRQPACAQAVRHAARRLLRWWSAIHCGAKSTMACNKAYRRSRLPVHWAHERAHSPVPRNHLPSHLRDAQRRAAHRHDCAAALWPHQTPTTLTRR